MVVLKNEARKIQELCIRCCDHSETQLLYSSNCFKLISSDVYHMIVGGDLNVSEDVSAVCNITKIYVFLSIPIHAFATYFKIYMVIFTTYNQLTTTLWNICLKLEWNECPLVGKMLLSIQINYHWIVLYYGSNVIHIWISYKIPIDTF